MRRARHGSESGRVVTAAAAVNAGNRRAAALSALPSSDGDTVLLLLLLSGPHGGGGQAVRRASDVRNVVRLVNLGKQLNKAQLLLLLALAHTRTHAVTTDGAWVRIGDGC